MKALRNKASMFVIVSQLTGCVGLDIVHSQKTYSGDPAEIEGATKTTYYRSDYKWIGLYLSFIIPIPLIIPYGKESQTLWIKNQELIYQEDIKTTTTGYGCSIWMECGELITWGSVFLEPESYH